jgi:hypothetical protein
MAHIEVFRCPVKDLPGLVPSEVFPRFLIALVLEHSHLLPPCGFQKNCLTISSDNSLSQNGGVVKKKMMQKKNDAPEE